MWSDYQYELWSEAQRDAAPNVRVLSDTIRIARKPHACDTCPHPIEPGMRYRALAMLEDGRFETSKMHDKPCWTYRIARPMAAKGA